MEEESTGQSKLFVILAVSLIGLLVLGLLGIGGVIVIKKDAEQQTIASRPTPTALIRLPTPQPTPSPTPALTKTPLPTPTSTVVAQAHTQAEAAAANRGGSSPGGASQPTAKISLPTSAPAAPPAAKAVPSTGLDGFQTILMVASLIAVLAVARRLRS